MTVPERTERVSGGEYEVPAGEPTLVLLEVMSGQVSFWAVKVENLAYSVDGSRCYDYISQVGENRNAESPVKANAGSFLLPASATWRPTVQ